jgi:hypothetical protein
LYEAEYASKKNNETLFFTFSILWIIIQLFQFEQMKVHNCIKITIISQCTGSCPYWCLCFIQSFFDALKVVNMCSLLALMNYTFFIPSSNQWMHIYKIMRTCWFEL